MATTTQKTPIIALAPRLSIPKFRLRGLGLKRLLSPRVWKARAIYKREIAQIDLVGWNRLFWEASALPSVGQGSGRNGIGGARKYFEFQRFLRFNIERYLSLKIRGEALTIVDLGCGAGYFVYVAIRQGHFALGVDRDESPDFDQAGPKAFQMMTDFLGIPKIHHTIHPFEPLPEVIRDADMITGFNAWFDGKYGPNRTYIPWGLPEWEYFLKDVHSRLRGGGRVFFEINDKWEYQEGYRWPKGLVGVMERCGFHVERLDEATGLVDLRKQGPA